LTPFLPNSSGSCSRWVATAPQINQIVNGGRFEKIQIDFFFLLLKNDPPNSNRNLLLGLHDHNLNWNKFWTNLNKKSGLEFVRCQLDTPKVRHGGPPDRCGRGWAYVSKGTYKKERGDVCVATTKVKK
jgi:hypothetical protein